MKIYTKTGDDGTTSLFSGERVPKNAPAIQACGTIDECNCWIGLALSQFSLEEELDKLRSQLKTVQNTLFELGAHIATPRDDANPHALEVTRFGPEGVTQLEKWIDQMDKKLPALKNFILPGGDPGGATLHLARSVCRRAERELYPLLEAQQIDEEALHYINRLSDYLFQTARFVNHITHTPEKIWKKQTKTTKDFLRKTKP